MLIGFNLAPVAASTYWPQDQWIALLTMAFTGHRRWCVLRGFWSRIAIFLGLVFGYVALLALRPDLRADPLANAGRQRYRPLAASTWTSVQGRALVRLPPSRPGHTSVGFSGLPPSGGLHPARPAGRDRPGRRERRTRQGGRRDDQRPPRPVHGAGHRGRRRRHRARHRGRRPAHHHVRREHRRHGRDPGVLHRRVLVRRRSSRSCSASARSSARSSRPPRAACSAGSPSSSTA